jgi:hypothetical protein
MTDDRSIDRILERAARSWIELGPTAAPPRVVDAALALIDDTPQERDWFPWRSPHMTPSARVVALVAIGALVLAGAFAFAGIGGRGSPLPSTAPSPSQAAASPALALSQRFHSEGYGYTVGFPAGWNTRSAIESWVAGEQNIWNSGINDELSLAGAGMRFSGASIALGPGQTADDWLTAYAAAADRATWAPITIDGRAGFLTADGVAAAGGTIAPGGRMFDAVVIDGDRAYDFNMDGNVDRATFDAFIATIKLDPSAVMLLPSLEKPFSSTWYGYTILRSGDWTVKPATTHWTGVDNSPPAVDEITVTGTDTTIPAASQRLPKDATYAAWLDAFHRNTVANVPSGCDGGEPSAWPTVQIGDQQGKLEMLCNAAEALVEVGGRVYVFDWSNSTFDGAQHLGLASWKRVLETVVFEPSKAVDR